MTQHQHHNPFANQTDAEVISARAFRAVTRANALRPGLESFARALTGNKKLRVTISGSGASYTNGRDVWITPPIELGDNHQHQRSLCSSYDDEGNSKCPACAAMDGLIRPAEHEIGHLTMSTFERANPADVAEIIELAAEGLYQAHKDDDDVDLAVPAFRWRERIERAVAKSQSRSQGEVLYEPMGSYVALARFVSPWMPSILNCFEDARVNEAIHQARPGSRRYFRSTILALLRDGIELPDGTRAQFADRPINAQIPVASLVVASGYDHDIELGEIFDPVVADLLAQPEIEDILHEVAQAESAKDVFGLGRRFLAAVQAHGWLPDPAPERLAEGDPVGPPDPTALELEIPNRKPTQSEDNDHDADDQQESDPDPDPEADTDAGTDAPSDDGDEREPSDPGEHGEAGPTEEPEPDPGSGPGDDAQSDHDESDDDPTIGAPEDDGPSADGDPGPSESGTGDPEDDEPGAGQTSDEDAGDDCSGDRSDDDESSGGGSSDSDDDDSAGAAGADDDQAPRSSGSDHDDSDYDDDDDDAGWNDGEGVDGSLGDDRDVDDRGAGDDLDDDDLDDDGWDDDDDDDDSSAEPAHDSGGSDQGLSNEDIERQAAMSRADLKIAAGHADELSQLKQDLSDLAGQDYDDDEDLPAVPEPDAAADDDEDDVDWSGGSDEMQTAVDQHEYFDAASDGVAAINVLRFGQWGVGGWDRPGHVNTRHNYTDGPRGKWANFGPEGVDAAVRSTLNRARLVFAENRKVHRTRNQRTGQLHTPTAGRKLKTGDVRVFGARLRPDKRDYVALIGFDHSGSTDDGALRLIKQAVYGQAELLDRLGIPFAVYGHSDIGRATASSWRPEDTLDLTEVKSFDEPWNAESLKRLKAIGPMGSALDGHNIEVYRKMLLRQRPASRTTERILMYYTDGDMPAANRQEETQVLIEQCRSIEAQPKFHLLAVGAGTSSPLRYGMDTVRVDTPDDIRKVIERLSEKIK